MAGPITAATEALAFLEETWGSQWYMNPTEKAKVADYVLQPESRKVGNKLHLRKVKTIVASEGSAGASLKRDNLTFSNNTEEEVTASPVFAYAGVQIPEITLLRTKEDGALRAAYRKMISAALNVKLDTALFALAPYASVSESGTDIDDGMYRRLHKKLKKSSLGKFDETAVKRFFIHTDEVDAAMDVPALKQYDIRGQQGAAVSGELVTTYGIKTVDSSLVYNTGGTAYQPLMLPDAWALAYNRKPSFEEPQKDGFDWFLMAAMEYAVAELFDSSIVTANTAITA